jgi:hypothetical protein
VKCLCFGIEMSRYEGDLQAAQEWRPAGFVFSAAERNIEEQLDTLLFAHPKSGWAIVAVSLLLLRIAYKRKGV